MTTETDTLTPVLLDWCENKPDTIRKLVEALPDADHIEEPAARAILERGILWVREAKVKERRDTFDAMLAEAGALWADESREDGDLTRRWWYNGALNEEQILDRLSNITDVLATHSYSAYDCTGRWFHNAVTIERDSWTGHWVATQHWYQDI